MGQVGTGASWYRISERLVKAWVKRHKRFHVHFIPTSSSWPKVIERFSRDLDDKRVNRGASRSVPELVDAVTSYIEEHNENPKPFIRKRTAEQIIEKIGRARLALNNAPTG